MSDIEMDEKHEKPHSDQIELATADKDSSSVSFDPSRSKGRCFIGFPLHAVVGIIKRKALIRDLAAAYHDECLTYCRELLELQRKWGEMYYTATAHKVPQEDTRREMVSKPLKRPKKNR